MSIPASSWDPTAIDVGSHRYQPPSEPTADQTALLSTSQLLAQDPTSGSLTMAGEKVRAHPLWLHSHAAALHLRGSNREYHTSTAPYLSSSLQSEDDEASQSEMEAEPLVWKHRQDAAEDIQSVLMSLPLLERGGLAVLAVARAAVKEALALHSLTITMQWYADKNSIKSTGAKIRRALLRLGKASREATSQGIDATFDDLVGDSPGAILDNWHAIDQAELVSLHERGALAALDSVTAPKVMGMDPDEWATTTLSAIAADDKKLKEEEAARRKKLQEEEEARLKKLQEEEEARLKKLKATQDRHDRATTRFDRVIKTLNPAAFSDDAKQILWDSDKMHGANTGALTNHIKDVLCGETGLDSVFEPGMSVLSDRWAGDGSSRWVLWERSSDGRVQAMGALAAAIAKVVHDGYLPLDRTGFMLPGVRGTGKSAILRAAAAAGWAFTQDGVIPGCKARIVPVIIDCKPFASKYNETENWEGDLDLEDPKGDVDKPDPLAIVVDRALQLAGERPSMIGVPKAKQKWLRDMGEVDDFLSDNHLVLALVLDEIDEVYKKTARISETLVGLQNTKSHIACWLTASAAYAQPLLFEPEANNDVLKLAGYPHDYSSLHNGKMIPLPPLKPMVTLEEHVSAMREFRLVDELPPDMQLVEAIKEFEKDPNEAAARLELATLLLEYGSVLRQLELGTPGQTAKTRPGDKAKMAADLSTSPPMISVLHSIAKGKLGDLSPEAIAKRFAEQTPTKKSVLPWIGEEELTSKVAAAGNVSFEKRDLAKELGRLADSGVLVHEEKKWVIASWAAVAAVIESFHDLALSNDIIAKLMSPERRGSAPVTEAVLVHALHRGAIEKAEICAWPLGAPPKEEQDRRLASLSRALRHGHAPNHNSLMEEVRISKETGEIESEMNVDEFMAPNPDDGIDNYGFFVDGINRSKMHEMGGQEKASGATKNNGVPKLLSKTADIVKHVIDTAPSLESAVREAKRLNPEVKDLYLWRSIVTNRRTAPTTAATIGKHVKKTTEPEASKWLKAEDGSGESITVIDGVTVHGPAWLLCGRQAVLDHLPPAVMTWAKRENVRAWSLSKKERRG